MAGKPVRAVIAGASTPLGKELAEQLSVAAGGPWDLTLVDEGEGGQITAAGDEALLVSAITDDTFAGVDLVCFAGDKDLTHKHWQAAHAAGAAIVDLSAALEQEGGAIVLAPGLGRAPADLATAIAVPAHPAAVMLATVLRPVTRVVGNAVCAATVLSPASQWGEQGIDELHRQTVSLLSFHSVPKEFFDTQTAFALVNEFGPAAKANLLTEENTVRRHLHQLMGDEARCAVQLVQAPVFHGFSVSMWVAAQDSKSVDALLTELRQDTLLGLQEEDGEEVSNTSATGQPKVLVRARADAGEGANGVWLWLAADNLLLAAHTAVACAVDLIALRPPSTLQ